MKSTHIHIGLTTIALGIGGYLLYKHFSKPKLVATSAAPAATPAQIDNVEFMGQKGPNFNGFFGGKENVFTDGYGMNFTGLGFRPARPIAFTDDYSSLLGSTLVFSGNRGAKS